MKFSFSVELKALIKAFIFSILLSFICGLVVYYTSLSELLLPTVGKVILLLTAFYAALSATRVRGSKGLIRGVNMGAAVFILVFIATLALQPAAVAIKTFIYSLLLCLVAGALGGVVGVGLHK